MSTHPVTTIRIGAGLLLGAILGACLPSMPDGEREVLCWTDYVRADHDCTVDSIRCFDRIDPVSEQAPEKYAECSREAERCVAVVNADLEQCEARTGCVAAFFGCQDQCLQVGVDGAWSVCQEGCTQDFEQCAEWYDYECELECELDTNDCYAFVTDAPEQILCEIERTECIEECY